MRSDDDIDMPVGDLELGPAQGKSFAARMAAGPQIELPAVPGADDVLALRVVLQHAGFAVFVHRLADPAVDAALADRPAAMGALIVPRDQLAIDIEHADFGAVAGNHPPLTLGQLADPPHNEGFHLSFPSTIAVLPSVVMPVPGLDPGLSRASTPFLPSLRKKAWMAGTSPAMTPKRCS